jgi:hypothetical protein
LKYNLVILKKVIILNVVNNKNSYIMNLDAIKKKLESMQKTSNGGSNNSSNVKRFKPTIGKQTIRIVPFKYNKEYPFTEMKFYYGIGSRKVIASPLNWGEKDPIAEFAKQLRGTNDKENWRLAKKLDPKTRIYAPVIVRGEESEGVQLWEFGKEIYEAFLQMAADEEVGDFTDVMSGRDIKLVTVGPESTGTAYNKTTIAPSMKTSELSEDSKLIEKWLEEQENPKDLYKPLPFDTIKQALQEWLNPEEEEEETAVEPVDEAKEEPKSNYSLSTKPAAKKSKAEAFDDLFGEDDEDAPF